MGYYMQIAFQEFGISWTMPLCVLTLRLTGVAFDYYDGQKKPREDGKPESDSALVRRPTYLEMLGHTFFFGGILVGPQFSMKRYLAFVNGEYAGENSLAPKDSIAPGFRRMLMGIIYIAIFQLCALVLPNSYMVSQSFRDLGLLTKCVLILIWGKNALHKYCGIWLLQMKRASNSPSTLSSKRTRYVHRRLRFLGSKMLSQAITLFYLALWHGLQSGYYMCFFLELMETKAEAEIYSSVYFIGHIACVGAIAAAVSFRAISRPSPKANGVHMEKKTE
ncbi:lysophospholipid acyltransferase, partial [Elysia marginata]